MVPVVWLFFCSFWLFVFVLVRCCAFGMCSLRASVDPVMCAVLGVVGLCGVKLSWFLGLYTAGVFYHSSVNLIIVMLY